MRVNAFGPARHQPSHHSDNPVILSTFCWMPPAHTCLTVLYSLAAQRGFTGDDADDLVQDVLVAALEQGRAMEDASFPRWAAGVLRRRALFVARTAGRRRRREAAYAADDPSDNASSARLPRSFIDALSPSLKSIALLANAGLGRAEIASLLRISDAALRQRISGLRRAWRQAGLTAEISEKAILPPHDGPRRRILKSGLTRLPDARFAISDPDGHAIFVSDSAHKRGNRGN